MLSPGLGAFIPYIEKQQLFQDAKRIADLLDEVMIRRTKEEKEGKTHQPYPSPFPKKPQKVKQGLEQLGQTKHLKDELDWIAEGQEIRPGLKPLRASDLPPGVTAKLGYDHRGHCLNYEHNTLRELGKIVLEKLTGGKMLIQAELFVGEEDLNSPHMQKRRKVFEEIVKTVDKSFNENFPGKPIAN